jgi:nucleoside-diphosphate-sugar epimerase
VRLLVLGGTSFVGRAIVDDALQSGIDVTLFNRGHTGAELFPAIERRIGDRDHGDYTSLCTADRWDAVIDVSGYVPRHVNQTMDALGDRIGRYLFVSSRAVYVRDPAGAGEAGADESTPLRAPVRDTEELSEATYGPLKVACEEDITARLGGRTTIVRPGKVAGPYDPQPGLTYWVRRCARSGQVALPGDPEQPNQLIDSRALARLVVQLVADDRAGTFNAVGPSTTMAELIHTCARVAGASVDIVRVPEEEFFPLVRPRSMWAALRCSPARAYAAGMPEVPLEVTAADVLAWDRARGEPPLDDGYTFEQEAAVLARTVAQTTSSRLSA